MLAALHSDCFDLAWSDATLQEFISTDFVLVSEDRAPSALMGFIIVRHLFDEAEIISLGVAKAARQLGLAASLLGTACTMLRKRGVQKLFLEVAKDNKAALALYLRAGFSQIAVRKGYYERNNGPPIDALVMSAMLVSNTIAPTS